MTRKRFIKLCMGRKLDKNIAIKCAETAKIKFDSYEHAMQCVDVLGVRRYLKFFNV